MISFIVEHNVNHLTTFEEDNARKERVVNVFGLPFPEKLEITLSSEIIRKIKYFYQFMRENKINKLEFYISSKDIGNSFVPLNHDMPFETNEYLDFEDIFFPTFNTQSSCVQIDTFYNNVTFSFLYNNSWTEECFEYTHPINQLITL